MTSRTKLPEAERQAGIVEALALIGRTAFRVQSGKVKVRGGWMQLAPVGTPDLYVLGWGWLECKAERGKLSMNQLVMHERIRHAGELVAVVRTPAEAVAAVTGGKARGGLDG